MSRELLEPCGQICADLLWKIDRKGDDEIAKLGGRAVLGHALALDADRLRRERNVVKRAGAQTSWTAMESKGQTAAQKDIALES
eukprot:3877921-Pleurochrysis_carterae.AAC.1